MATERKTMALNGVPGPVLETPPVHRRVSSSNTGRSGALWRTGEVGQLLRREGLYSSHLTSWRKSRREGALKGLASKKRGVKPMERNPLDSKVRELEAKVARLEKELHQTHTILDVQEKVAGLLGFNLKDGSDC